MEFRITRGCVMNIEQDMIEAAGYKTIDEMQGSWDGLLTAAQMLEYRMRYSLNPITAHVSFYQKDEKSPTFFMYFACMRSTASINEIELKVYSNGADGTQFFYLNEHPIEKAKEFI